MKQALVSIVYKAIAMTPDLRANRKEVEQVISKQGSIETSINDDRAAK